MDFNDPNVRRGLLGAAALLLVIAIIGVLIVNSDDSTKKKNVAANGTTSSTVALAPGETTTPTAAGSVTTAKAAGGTATTARGGATATTAKPSAPTVTVKGPAPKPGPTKPPAPGTYTYAQKSSDGSSSDTTTVYETEPDSGGAAHRRQTAPAFGGTVTNEETWSATSVTITSAKISNPVLTQPIDCDWKPDVLVYALPLAINKSWTTDSSCSGTAQTKVGPQPYTIHLTGSMKVTGQVLDSIGGTTVPTWVIEGSETVTSPQGTVTVNLTEHFSSDKGLIVYEHDNDGSTTTERTLKSLTPS